MFRSFTTEKNRNAAGKTCPDCRTGTLVLHRT